MQPTARNNRGASYALCIKVIHYTVGQRTHYRMLLKRLALIAIRPFPLFRQYCCIVVLSYCSCYYALIAGGWSVSVSMLGLTPFACVTESKNVVINQQQDKDTKDF